MIVAGSGARVQDIHGRSYIDAMAGLWCVNVGYGRVELGDAMRAHAERLGYYHAFSSMGTDTPGLLAERLIELAPAGMSKVFFGCTGSDANDTQVKLVWFYNNVLGRPEKKKIIARNRGYHGVSVMSAGLTGLPGLHAELRPAAADDPAHDRSAPALGGGAGHDRRGSSPRSSPTTSRR